MSGVAVQYLQKQKRGGLCKTQCLCLKLFLLQYRYVLVLDSVTTEEETALFPCLTVVNFFSCDLQALILEVAIFQHKDSVYFFLKNNINQAIIQIRSKLVVG